AAATHPDRADGGDRPRFAAAAAAYTTLRTISGRSEALADLARPAGRAHPGQQRRRRWAGTGPARLPAGAGPARLLARARRGRPPPPAPGACPPGGGGAAADPAGPRGAA